MNKLFVWSTKQKVEIHCDHNSEDVNVAVGRTYLKPSALNSYTPFQDFIHKMYRV